MKKNIFALALAIASLSLASCNVKLCHCCEMVGNDIISSDTYTDIDARCESLNTNSRKCMEDGSQLPCSAIAFDFKK